MSWQISWQKIKLQIKFDFQTCLPKGTNICLKTSYYICIKTVQSLLMHGKLSNYTWLFELTLKHCCNDSKNADKWFVVIKDDSFVHFVETLMKFTDNTFLECTEISLFLCWRGWMPYNFNIVSHQYCTTCSLGFILIYILESLILLFHYQWWISRIFYC